MNEFQYFDFCTVLTHEECCEIQENLLMMSGVELDEHYEDMLKKGTCMTKNQKIEHLDFLCYYIELRKQWNYFLMNCMSNSVKAMFFEFDTLFRWSGKFYACSDYLPLNGEDDNWSSDSVIAEWDVPDFELLAIVYNGCCDKCMGGCTNKKSLIAKTVATFKKVVEMNHPGVPVCVHYKYQDPLLRLFNDCTDKVEE